MHTQTHTYAARIYAYDCLLVSVTDYFVACAVRVP